MAASATELSAARLQNKLQHPVFSFAGAEYHHGFAGQIGGRELPSVGFDAAIVDVRATLVDRSSGIAL